MGGCVKKNRNTEKWYAQAKRGKVKCRLHPLIHTLLKFNLAQDIENIKSGAEAPQCCWEMQNLTKNDAVALQSPYL